VVVVVVVGLPVDDQQVASVHVDSPNIVYNKIEDNENFDKKDQQLMDKMHMVHFLVKMDQCQAKHHQSNKLFTETNSPFYGNNHILYQ
jgi:aspartate carbamoyltransferase regulatory subunit